MQNTTREYITAHTGDSGNAAHKLDLLATLYPSAKVGFYQGRTVLYMAGLPLVSVDTSPNRILDLTKLADLFYSR